MKENDILMDPIGKAKRTRASAKSKFSRKCNAFKELSQQQQPFAVLKDKFDDIRASFQELDNANDRLVETINEYASHGVLDSLLQECDEYMKVVESTLDEIRAIHASHASENSSSSRQIQVKALDAPRFTGDIREYANFKHDFKRLMEPAYGKDAYALRSCLLGSALQTVKGVADDYDQMFQRLDNVFGNPRKFVDSIIYDITSIKPVHEGDTKKFVKMVDTIERCWLDLKRTNLTEEMDTIAMISMVEKLLPPTQKREWILLVDSADVSSGMFERLLNYLLREKRVIEYTEQDIRTEKARNVHHTLTNPPQQQASSNTKQEVVNYASGSTQNHRSPETRSWCWIHKTPSHSVEFCAKFLEMSVAERFEAAKQAGACFKCLKNNRHIAKNCLHSSQCTVFEKGQICGKRHHPLFHRKLDSDTAVNQNNEVHNVLGNDDRPILAVNAIQCKNQLINVMWDSGGQYFTHYSSCDSKAGVEG